MPNPNAGVKPWNGKKNPVMLVKAVNTRKITVATGSRLDDRKPSTTGIPAPMATRLIATCTTVSACRPGLMIQSSKMKARRTGLPRAPRLVGSLSSQPARDHQRLAGDPRGIVPRGQEHYGRRDIVRLADAAQWSGRFDLLAKIAFVKTLRMQAFGLDHARVDRVHSDATRAELLGQRARHGVNCRLGRGVHRGVGRCDGTHDRADVDDAAAAFAEVLRRFLRGENEP